MRLESRIVTAALALIACAAACGDDDDDEADAAAPAIDAAPDAAPSRIIEYAAPGAIVGAGGVGSFRFGAASSAMQIEGDNANVDWYVFSQPEREGGLGQGEAFLGEAAHGYERMLDDVALLEALHVDAYRFGIEWSRVEPQRDQIDEAALTRYGDFIDALLAAGIRPMITLHHYANPIWVDDPRDPDCAAGPTDANLCGWGDPVGGALVVDEFAAHVALLAARFGDRVDEWATVNEPVNYLIAGYGVGSFAPGKARVFDLLAAFVPTMRDYIAAHVAAYDALRAGDTTDADGDGVAAAIGLTLAVNEWVPAAGNQISDAPIDVAARDRVQNLFHYQWVDSLRVGGLDTDFDGAIDEQHPEWAGKLDWLGVQYYFRTGVTGSGAGLVPVLDLVPCIGGFDFGSCLPPLDASHNVPVMGYEYYEAGLGNALIDLGERWPDLPMVVTEGGIATEVGARRAENLVRSLEQIERARAAGADVRGYYHWSLYDNFEFVLGFRPRFGLYQVDYETYERTPTLGAEVLGEIAGAHRLDEATRDAYGGEGPMTAEP